MTGHEGDLLKQATQKMMARAGDEETDHIGSDTPRSGIATPQPDPSDKRLPGIMHSYFGQVGSRSSSSTHSSPAGGSVHGGKAVDSEPKEELVEDYVMLSVASGKQETSKVCPAQENAGSSLPGQTQPDGAPETSQTRALHPYPTPPLSLSSSAHNLKAITTPSLENENVRKAVPSVPAHRKSVSVSESFPSGARRASMINWNPLSSVVTASNVHAADFSKPSEIPATTPSTPTHSRLNSYFHESSSYDQLKKLTDDATRKKSIPPTPTRALSSTTAESEGSNPDAPAEKNDKVNGKEPRPTVTSVPLTRSSSSTGASAPSARGKLTVKIVEARGLKKSRDPYVVAVFQRNELVSKGPRPEFLTEHDPAHIPYGGIPISRSGSDTGRPMAIPMKSRQSSNTSLSEYRDFKAKPRVSMTNPKWDTEAVFDVVGPDTTVNITVYDGATDKEELLGHVDLQAHLLENDSEPIRGWFSLRGKDGADQENPGEIFIEITFQQINKRHYGPDDFQTLKLIGKGTFGQVYQVRKRDTKRIYAMKVLQKKVIVQKKEVAHTVGERNILVRTAMTDSPFIVGLKFSFQTPTDLYLVTDYMSGGELFWHLQKEGRFDEKRAKFYIAELILALEHLHTHDIVYRDLKPENILLDANGHIALCDFGLSKANLTKNATTNTFCGTTEYLAPEVLLDEAGYTKMVDFWSLGVLVFEMCCGWSPFYAEDTQQMYKNIAFGKVRFPRDTLTTEGRNFVKGLLNRNPKHRLGATHDAQELKEHPFFADIDWVALTKKQLTPPFKPKLSSETDTSNFDPEFTNAPVGHSGPESLNARAAALASNAATSTPLSPTMQANFKGFTFVDESSIHEHMQGRAHDNYDDMDEDDKRGEDGWEDSFDVRGKEPGDRMSGIVKTGTNEDSNMFNGNFEP